MLVFCCLCCLRCLRCLYLLPLVAPSCFYVVSSFVMLAIVFAIASKEIQGLCSILQLKSIFFAKKTCKSLLLLYGRSLLNIFNVDYAFSYVSCDRGGIGRRAALRSLSVFQVEVQILSVAPTALCTNGTNN